MMIIDELNADSVQFRATK